MPELSPDEQYASVEQQATTLRFGMWVFLASELLLFAGFFALYAAYREMYSHDFQAALHLNTTAYGTVNTYVLLTSSLTVALSSSAVRRGSNRVAALWLVASALLGCAFLVIKAAEYAVHIHEGALVGRYYHFAAAPTFGGNRFYTLYWAVTGTHALHVTGGIGVLLWLAWQCLHDRYRPRRDEHPKFEMATLYWHFVDIMWIFIWPIFYLT